MTKVVDMAKIAKKCATRPMGNSPLSFWKRLLSFWPFLSSVSIVKSSLYINFSFRFLCGRSRKSSRVCQRVQQILLTERSMYLYFRGKQCTSGLSLKSRRMREHFPSRWSHVSLLCVGSLPFASFGEKNEIYLKINKIIAQQKEPNL